MSVEVEGAGGVARYAIEAAVWAPSVHHTRPWWFGVCCSGAGADMTVSLHVDGERRLGVADPADRETLIGCGAALCTLRLAVLRCGRDPEVRVLPDPDRPGLLAEVRLGGPVPVTGEVRQLYAQVRRRRSHRGPFLNGRVEAPVLSGLREEAWREDAVLHVASAGVRVALAALTKACDQAQRLDPEYVVEPARRTPGLGGRPRDGIGESAYPGRAGLGTRPRLPGLDRAPGHGWGSAGPGAAALGMGVVAVLTTEGDQRRDWVAAGQALQRVSLSACAAGLSVDFHTQALAPPELRQFIGARFFDGAHPQIVVRLGAAHSGIDRVRRPVGHSTNDKP